MVNPMMQAGKDSEGLPGPLGSPTPAYGDKYRASPFTHKIKTRMNIACSTVCNFFLNKDEQSVSTYVSRTKGQI